MAHLTSVALLVGAHGTGTAHLQATLLALRDRLAPEGVGVIGPQEVRSHLRPVLSSPAQTREVLTHLCPGAQHVVVMAENTLGTPHRSQVLGQKGLIYPFATRRLRDMVSAFGEMPVRVGLGIRNPATFLPACWVEQLLQGQWQPFAAYAAGVPANLPRWSWLINRMAQASDDLTIWTHEDYPAVLPQIVDWATGLEGLGASLPPDTPPAQGLSQRTAEVLHARMTANPERNHRVTLRRLSLIAPVGAAHPPFVPWTTAEQALLDQTYAEDLLQLATTPHLGWLTSA